MNMIALHHLLGFTSSLLLGYFLMPHIISIAHMLRLVDRPDGKLKRHQMPTAYLGGVGVFLPFAIVSLFFGITDYRVGMLLTGCLALLLLGLYDDVRQLSPLQRIVIEAAVVLFFIGGGLFPEQSVLPPWIFWPLGFLWMLTTINAFNLIDVRDGIAATVSMSCAGMFLWCAVLAGQYEVSLLFAVAIGAMLAFFWFNQPPARIYLGDAGALCLGGFFAAAPMMISWSQLHGWGFLAVPTILAVPFFEVITLILVRWYYRIPFYNGSPHHFVHFLERKGWSPRKILCRTAFTIILTGVLAIFFLRHFIPVLYWLPLGTVGYISWLVILLR
jgi:UDP-GlcNAc:undecaprenyl-phosphate GlcNAc-1-phosphate transferase